MWDLWHLNRLGQIFIRSIEPWTNTMFRIALPFCASTVLLAIVIVGALLTLFSVWGILLAAILLATAAYVRTAESMGLALQKVVHVAFGVTCLTCVIGLPFAIDAITTTVPRQALCLNNLKRIGLALEAYRSVNGRYPPARTLDENGKPLHSWRLLILPFLEKKPLYDACKLEQPWDGPSNSEFTVRTSLREFLCPSNELTARERDRAVTNYLAVVGPGTAWEDVTARQSDGPSNRADKRVLVVETPNSDIAWAQPQDLTLEEACRGIGDEPGQRIGNRHKRFSGWPFYHDEIGGANVLCADGSCASIPAGLPPEVIKGVLLGDETSREKANNWIPTPKRRIHWPNCIALACLALATPILIFRRRDKRNGTPTDISKA